MKYFLIILILFSIRSFSADLNLFGGESITIIANTKTEVSCNGPTGGKCADIAKGLQKLVEGCGKTYSQYFCFTKYWPELKKNNPSCSYIGLEICMDSCMKKYSGGYCADTCSQSVKSLSEKSVAQPEPSRNWILFEHHYFLYRS